MFGGASLAWMRGLTQQGIRPVSFDSIDVISGAGVEGQANGHRYQLISQKSYGRNLDMDIPKEQPSVS